MMHTQPCPEPARALPSLELSLFGPPRIYWRRTSCDLESAGSKVDITDSLQPRALELLVFLASRPNGVSRDALTEALWSGRPPSRPIDAVNCTLSRLRKAITNATGGAVSRIMTDGAGPDKRGKFIRYELAVDAIEVDFWNFVEAVRRRRRAVTDDAREASCRMIVHVAAGGELADGLGFEWIQPVRQAVRRDVIIATEALSALMAHRAPRQALALIESVLDLDPHNERLYRDMIMLHAKLGEYHAIDHTIALLVRRLAELDDAPTPEILELVREIRCMAA